MDPDNGSALQCGLWPLARRPPTQSALCSLTSELLPHPPQKAGRSGWISCAATASSPPKHLSIKSQFFPLFLFNKIFRSKYTTPTLPV